jgi:hypothetical protein
MSDIKATAVIHRSLMHKGPRVAPDMQETALCQFVAQWPPNLPELVQISGNQEWPIHTYVDNPSCYLERD